MSLRIRLFAMMGLCLCRSRCSRGPASVGVSGFLLDASIGEAVPTNEVIGRRGPLFEDFRVSLAVGLSCLTELGVSLLCLVCGSGGGPT